LAAKPNNIMMWIPLIRQEIVLLAAKPNNIMMWIPLKYEAFGSGRGAVGSNAQDSLLLLSPTFVLWLSITPAA
jgi:hypothetical protein